MRRFLFQLLCFCCLDYVQVDEVLAPTPSSTVVERVW